MTPLKWVSTNCEIGFWCRIFFIFLAVLADEVVGLIVKERYWQPKLKGRNNFNKIIGCHDKWLMSFSHSHVNLSCTNAKEKTNKKGH